MPRIVVVGAGISGLTLAYRLQQRRPDVELIVLEQSARAGGVIDTVRRDGFTVEGGPNAFPDNNPATLALARDLGLESQLVPASEAAGRNRYLLVDGRLQLLPNSFGSFVTSDLLSPIAKVRLLAERFRPRRTAGGEESIDAFARRRVGSEVANTLADAFVTGIVAGDPKLLSVEACFPRLVKWEREHGSVTKGMAAARKQRREAGLGQRAGRTWSFDGGMGRLVEGLVREIKGGVRLGVEVRRVRMNPRNDKQEVVVSTEKEELSADFVVLTCPAHQQARLLADLDPPLAEQLAAIAYNRVAVVALGYRRADVPHHLDGFGYLSPQRTRRDVLGVQWCSSIFPGRAPEGTVLVRAMCGGWHRGEMVDWDDDRLLAAVRKELAQSLGVRVAPVFQHVVRWQRAIPQYHVDHLKRVGWIDDRLRQYPGLFLGGNAYRGVAINDCVEQAGLLAEHVATAVGRRED